MVGDATGTYVELAMHCELQKKVLKVLMSGRGVVMVGKMRVLAQQYVRPAKNEEIPVYLKRLEHFQGLLASQD